MNKIFKIILIVFCIILVLSSIIFRLRACDYIGEVEVGELVDYTHSEIVIENPREEDIKVIARTLYGECRGVPSTIEKAAVAWVILNRVDAGYGDTILDVVSAPYQFLGYNPNHPVLDELYWIAEDVLTRWYLEKSVDAESGRILPKDYLYFHGDGHRNYFRKEFKSHDYWDWSLATPYYE